MKRAEKTSRVRVEEASRRDSGLLAVTVVVLLVLVVCSSARATSGYGNTNTSVASPVRSATTPLTGYQSGLVDRPNPVDNSSNLVVTGNVGAGKHFRDTVPYRSTTSMVAPLGSTSLDSFMRYSAVPETSTMSTSPYRPFYSPSGTTAAIQPGTSSVFSGSTSRVAAGLGQRVVDTPRDAGYLDVSQPVTPPTDTDVTTSADGLGAVPRLRLWPSSQGVGVPTDSLPGGTDELFLERRTSPRTDSITHDDYRRQMETLQQRLGEVKTEVAQLEQGLASREGQSQPSVEHLDLGMSRENESAVAEIARREQLLQETARLLAGATALPAALVPQEETVASDSKTEVFSAAQARSARRLQLYDPSRVLAQAERLGARPTVGATHASPAETGLAPPTNTYSSRSVGRAHPRPRMQAIPVVSAESYQSDNRSASPAPIAPETPVVQTSVQSPVRNVDAERTATVPKEFTRHMQLAERYFQQRAYQHAAETYGLALAYCPYEPHAHLGHSHASLAAGRYDASAASLAKALGLDSRYVLTKVDMVDLVGGPDAFLARFNELNEAVQSREAPMLEFLLAYICYQMDRPVEARLAIEAAQKTLPASVAIAALKAAIVP